MAEWLVSVTDCFSCAESPALDDVMLACMSAFISFHSLEDKLVKQRLRELVRVSSCDAHCLNAARESQQSPHGVSILILLCLHV